MEIQNKTGLKGHFTIKQIREGKVIDIREVDNTIMNVGLASVSGLILADVGGTAYDYIAIGIGATGSGDATLTALVSEIVTSGGQRTTGTGTQITTTVTNDTAQLVATFTFTGTFAVTESGIFNAAAAGTMLARQVFAAVNVVSGDSIEVTWKVKVS